MSCGCSKHKPVQEIQAEEIQSEQSSDTVLGRVKNLFLAVQDVAETRMSICRECDFFEERRDRCKKCGCFLVAKTKLKKTRCPIGKW